jgi:hypothetical protein
MNKKTQEKITKINEDKLKLLELKYDFIFLIKNWREKIGIPYEGFENDENGKISKIFKQEKTAFLPSEAVNEIMREFKLSPNYYKSIINYLLYDKFSLIPSSNYSKIINDKLINIKIFKKPSKEEWENIKKEVNLFLDLIKNKKITRHGIEIYYDPVSKKTIKKNLKVFEYPEGSKASRPKPKIDRNIDIMKKSKNKGKNISVLTDDDEKNYSYSDADIEAEVFSEDDWENSKKNTKNIKTIRHRMNKIINKK